MGEGFQYRPFAQGHFRGVLREDLHVEELLPALVCEAGEQLKSGGGARVRRWHGWIVKESAGPLWLRMAKQTLQGARYGQVWETALHLRKHGVLIPEPVAFVERGRFGLVSNRHMVSEYLDGHRNVEEFVRGLLRAHAGQDTLRAFLSGLGQSLLRLEEAGVYHADLSGKNILTNDGARFYFIDLDAAQVTTDYNDKRRMRNHVQLYDSFCDELSDNLLVPFLTGLLRAQHDPRVWMPEVRKRQRERRAKVVARWEREGKLPA
jgi:tRNA A-37 threonylcarbamoyl transferase component Bud32